MPDFLDVKRKEITDRMNELQPQVDEYGHLKAAAAALAKLDGATPAASSTTTATAAASRQRGPGRPRGSVNGAIKATPASAPAASTPATAARKKPGRPKGRKK